MPEPTDESMPFGSNDGKVLYFRSDRTGAYQLWKVPFDGGREEQLTTHGGYAGYDDGKTTVLHQTHVRTAIQPRGNGRAGAGIASVRVQQGVPASGRRYLLHWTAYGRRLLSFG